MDTDNYLHSDDPDTELILNQLRQIDATLKAMLYRFDDLLRLLKGLKVALFYGAIFLVLAIWGLLIVY